MMILDCLRMAGTALVRQRLRTGLSLLGVAIGVMSVIVLTSLGEGARRYVTGQFASLGTNLLVVIPGKNETTGGLPGMGGAPEDLTLQDAEAIVRRIPGANAVAPMSMATDLVSYGERGRQVPVIGTTSDFMIARHLRMAEGSFLPDVDNDRGAPIAVVGKKLAKELFRGERPVGKVVRVGDWRIRVIGVMDSRGVSVGLDMDDCVLVPVATGMRMFNRSSLFRILVDVKVRADQDETKNQVIRLLADRHQEEDVTVLTQDAVVSSFSSILNVLTMALAGIGGISLAVAGVGIMNVMLVSVSERTFEVGLMKAVGAKEHQILGVFLLEASLLSSLGGGIGLGLGLLSVEILGKVFPKFPAASPLWAIGLSIGVSVTVGVVFGLIPAHRASRLDPVVALARSK